MRSHGMLLAVGIMVVLLGSFFGSSLWAQGYRTERNSIVVDTQTHWETWSYPQDVVEITPDGWMRPVFFRKKINAVLNATQFQYKDAFTGKASRGGIRAVGSNSRTALNVMDGDSLSFWETDVTKPLEDWWVEVDLGRLVSAQRIVIRFAEDRDPFYQFRVATSRGELVPGTGNVVAFTEAGRTHMPNREQRVFEFEVRPTRSFSEEWTGNPVHYVRVQATDSRFGRAEEITEEQYEALPATDRGEIEYYIRDLVGEETIATREEYETVNPEYRGSIKYYRQERPAITEIEVWSVGDNIGLGVLSRGGSMHNTDNRDPSFAFDGLYETRLDAQCYSEIQGIGLVTIDLGALFWIDTIRLVTRTGRPYGGVLYGYVTRESDGTVAPDGSLIWKQLSPREREDNLTARIQLFEDRFPSHKVRYLDFKVIDITGARSGAYATFGMIGEFQLFGQGPAAELALASDLIELGAVRNLTTIEWEADTPPGTKIEIRTRTGDDLEEVFHYYNSSGVEITELEYNNTPSLLRGKVEQSYVAGPGWSTWSQFYEKSGDPISSPSPRAYMMLQAKIMSEVPDQVASLDFIRINFTDPVASRVVGEIFPNAGVLPGRPEDFQLFIRPTLEAVQSFDEVLIHAPGVEMSLLSAGYGTEMDVDLGEGTVFTEGDDGEFKDASGSVLKVIREGADSLSVRFPRRIRSGDAELVFLKFRSMLFLNGTTFAPFLATSARPGAWQNVDPGNATFMTESRGLTVSLPLDTGIISNLEIAPAPFTPNGDGVNDEVRISFSVLKVFGKRSARVRVYDLAGGLRWEMMDERSSAGGNYAILWDGRDDDGMIVPPGIYVCEVDVDADSDTAESTRVARQISVVY